MIQSSHDENASSSQTTLDSRNGHSSPEDTNVAPIKKYHKTQNDILKMLETETLHKETLSPFNPLPAIGQKIDNAWESRFKDKTIKSMNELLLDNLTRRKKSAQLFYAVVDEEVSNDDKTIPTLNEVNLKNHRLNIIHKNCDEDKRVDLLKEIKENKSKLFFCIDSDVEKKNDEEKTVDKNNNEETTDKSNTVLTNKTFEMKKRLLDRREREVFPMVVDEADNDKDKTYFKPIRMSKSDGVNKNDAHALIEIFDSLQISRKYKEKVKKPNYWF